MIPYPLSLLSLLLLLRMGNAGVLRTRGRGADLLPDHSLAGIVPPRTFRALRQNLLTYPYPYISFCSVRATRKGDSVMVEEIREALGMDDGAGDAREGATCFTCSASIPRFDAYCAECVAKQTAEQGMSELEAFNAYHAWIDTLR